MVPSTNEHVEQFLSPISQQRRAKKLTQKGQQFLKGPIPLPWLCKAAHLPGKAVIVALAIHYRAGVLKRRKGITLSRSVLSRFGVGRNAGYRGVTALEQVGLITAERKRGRCPRITIHEVSQDSEQSISA